MNARSLKFLGFAEQHSPQARKAQETNRPRRVAYFASWNAKNPGMRRITCLETWLGISVADALASAEYRK
jgi:hypothetical protein